MPSPQEPGPFDGPAPLLGPYRVIRPLGRGGMGEVVLAEDPRLGRRVAIKRLHPRADGRTLERRERFRREARILAKLRHPAIVQVYELLTVAGRDHLVMEHVDGPTLRQVIEDEGPLPADEVARLALRLAQGLDHAHRHGVVHRDLKTENVLLDTDGEPRLADFGLACSTPRLGGSDDTDLTDDGRVLGTVRAMAPEQVVGDEVDARTDLFALGVLLFEALTGRSPFEAATRRETVTRVLRGPAPPLGGGVPDELAELVGHLLEKDPALRPRSAGEVAARLAGIAAQDGETAVWDRASGGRPPASSRRRWWLAGVVLLMLLGAVGVAVLVGDAPGGAAPAAAPVPERLHVAVLPTGVSGVDDEEEEKIEFVVRSAVLRALGELDGVVPVGLGEVDEVAAGATAVEVARATAADELVWSEGRCDETECLVELARLDGESGEVLWSQPVQAPRADLETLVWATAEAVAGSLPARSRDGLEPPAPELAAELLALRWAQTRQSAAVDPEAQFERLGELRNRYGSHPQLALWRAWAAHRVFDRTGEVAWLERAFEALDDAQARWPDDSSLRLARADLQLNAGRPDAAAETIDRLARELPGDVRVDELRARWLLETGRPDEALAALGGAAERRPAWSRLFNLAKMAAETGRVGLAFETLDALDQRAPGYRPARRLAAELELKYGDLERAAELYGELAHGSGDVGSWTNLGVAHLLRRDAAAALEALTTARDLAPDSYGTQLNLADAYELAGDPAAARALYRAVAERLADAPATRLGVLVARSQARARLGRAPEAVADIEAALRLAPEDPDIRFTAALVYSLVGDLASAERNRRQALEMGYDERWFTLEAFDVLG